MKRIILLLGIGLIALFFVLSGCDENNDIDEVEYHWDVVEYDPGGSCCAVSTNIQISGESPSGGQYYWLALMDKDTIVKYGEPVYIQGGPFQDEALHLWVNYSDGINPGHYVTRVFSSSDESSIGQVKHRTLTQELGITAVESYADSVCTDCCTNNTNGGLRRYKAFAFKGFADLQSVGANIDTKYGRLCAEGTPQADSVESQQNCFVAILEQANGKDRQVQVGWMHRRANQVVEKFVYMEVCYYPGEPVIFIKYFPAPADSSSHFYAAYRPRSIDTVATGYFDGTPLDSVDIPSQYGWSIAPMNISTWQGEIAGKETDMPGTVFDPCFFDNCMVGIYGQGVIGAAFDNGLNSDSLYVTPSYPQQEWGIDYTPQSNSMWIWDIYPR